MAWHPKTYTNINSPTLYLQRRGFAQDLKRSARYTGVAPSYISEGVSASGIYLYHPSYMTGFVARNPSTKVTNKLHAKFRDEMTNSVSAQLLTSLVEVRDSYEMIARRAITMRRAFTALRRFDLPRVAKELALPRGTQRNVERRVSKKHYVTQNWLEYWMGWAPLWGDIQSAVKKLNDPPRSKPFRVTVTDSVESVVNGFTYWQGVPSQEHYSHYCKATIASRTSYGGHATCTNPQLALADQLGLLNPLATAWEVIPFSFIANWFVNLDQYLAAASPMYGFQVHDTYLNHKSWIDAGVVKNSRYHHVWPGPGWVHLVDEQKFTAKMFWRVSGTLPPVALSVSIPDRLSITRAATAVSLLTQLFIKPK